MKIQSQVLCVWTQTTTEGEEVDLLGALLELVGWEVEDKEKEKELA